MSYDYGSVNLQTVLAPDTGGVQEMIFSLKERLKANGWTHQGSGDGDALFSTTPGNGNDVITHAGSGANGLFNTLAWFILQQPAGGVAPYSGSRQFLFQVHSSFASDNEKQIHWGYSFSGGYAGGSPSANRALDFPSDVAFIRGGGTAAAPTFQPIDDGGGVRNYNIIVGDVDENFSWVMYSHSPGTADFVRLLMSMDGLESGSFPYGGGAGFQEPDPYVFNGRSITSAGLTEANFANLWNTWYRKGEVDETFYNTIDWRGIEDATFPANYWTKKDPQLPVIYARGTGLGSPSGIKGISHIFRWNGCKRPWHHRLSVAGTGDRLCVQHVTVPWNNAVPRV